MEQPVRLDVEDPLVLVEFLGQRVKKEDHIHSHMEMEFVLVSIRL
jgi:hypothetical protein